MMTELRTYSNTYNKTTLLPYAVYYEIFTYLKKENLYATFRSLLKMSDQTLSSLNNNNETLSDVWCSLRRIAYGYDIPHGIPYHRFNKDKLSLLRQLIIDESKLNREILNKLRPLAKQAFKLMLKDKEFDKQLSELLNQKSSWSNVDFNSLTVFSQIQDNFVWNFEEEQFLTSSQIIFVNLIDNLYIKNKYKSSIWKKIKKSIVCFLQSMTH